MSDQEIADALVEAGVIVSDWVRYKFSHWPWGQSLFAREAVNDWRVAGACLERCRDGWMQDLMEMTTAEFQDLLANPRAICEAFAVSEGRAKDA